MFLGGFTLGSFHAREARRAAALLLAAAAAAGLLAGCAATGGAEHSAAANPGANLPGAPTSDADWDLYRSNVKSQAETWHIDDPQPVEVKRWVKPEDVASYVNPCVEARGFQQHDGTWTGVTPEQRSVFNEAMYKCLAAYPEIPKYTRRLTDSQLRVLYDWTVNTEIPCLTAAGYEVGVAPSESVFIADYFSDPYFPFAQLPQLSQENFDALQKQCPQFPPSEILYGN